MIRDRRRLICFDPQEEYDYQQVTSLKELQKVMARDWNGFRVCYKPREDYEVQDLSALAGFLFKACKPYKAGRDPRQMCLVVEEIQISFPNEKLPAGHRRFEGMCQRGRHYGINVIGVTQQPATVSTRFRGNCSETHIFNLDWHTDIQAIGQMIGPANAKKIRQLKPHESYIYRNGVLTPRKNKIS
jgi:hypothetical protein